jgi:ribonuclease HI
MSVARKNMIAGLLGFNAGAVPFLYLGCPIFQGKPKVAHFRMITDKIKNKLATWKGNILSIMGRVQLVKSIIHGMLVYSFHVYHWPSRLLRLLDTWLKNFIWSGDVLTKKICTVSWSVMCRSWEEGGLNLKPTRLINEALIFKLSWDLLDGNSQWSMLFKRRYFSNGKPILRYFKSSVWSGIKVQVGTVLANSLWIIGTGENINFWMDNWLGEPLADLLNIDNNLHRHLKGTVAEAIVDGKLVMPQSVFDLGDVQERVHGLVLPRGQLQDVLIWPTAADGKLSSKQAFSFLRPRAPLLPWADSIWSSAIPPSHSCIYWRLHHGKMPTDENLRSRGCYMVSICNLCLNAEESSEHLFLRCSFSMQLWNWIGNMLHRVIDLSSVDSLLSCRPTTCSSQVSDIFLAAILHTLQVIWWVRNSLRFSYSTPSLHSAKIRIHSFIAMSGNLSKGKCIPSDITFLDSFAVSPNCRQVKDIIMVLWKTPTAPWLKVNTDGSVIGANAACGGLFRDTLGTFRGAFSCNIGSHSVFYAEVLAIIIAIEFAASKGWRHLWVESDSSSAILIFSNYSLVPIKLRNRWYNARQLGIQVISSHIFREGNCCADKLANMGHSMVGEIWLNALPADLKYDFFRDRCGLPNYRFP